MWKTQLHWLIYGWLAPLDPARGESCSTGRRGPASHGNDNIPSMNLNRLRTCATTTTGDENILPTFLKLYIYRTARCGNKAWKFQSQCLIYELSGAHRGASARRDLFFRMKPMPAAPGDGWLHPRVIYHSVHVQFQQPGHKIRHPPGRYHQAPWCSHFRSE